MNDDYNLVSSPRKSFWQIVLHMYFSLAKDFAGF